MEKACASHLSPNWPVPIFACPHLGTKAEKAFRIQPVSNQKNLLSLHASRLTLHALPTIVKMLQFSEAYLVKRISYLVCRIRFAGS